MNELSAVIVQLAPHGGFCKAYKYLIVQLFLKLCKWSMRGMKSISIGS